MLPYPALAIIIECIGDTQMGIFIELAQINRTARAFFLSDYVWKRFDVHQVHGQRNVYTYGDYQLVGIAAHYFNWLCSLHPHHRRWHMPFSEPSCSYTAELYDQLNYLTHIPDFPPKSVGEARVVRKLLGLDSQVWRCWLLHPLPGTRDWKINLASLSPLFQDKARYIKIASCIHLELLPFFGDFYKTNPDGFNPYQNDREVNLSLVRRGLWGITAHHFKRNADFLLEALDGIPRESVYLNCEHVPNLLDQLYKLNFDRAVDCVSKKPWRLAKFSEKIRNSSMFVFQCVRYNPECLIYAGELRDYTLLVKAAIKDGPFALRYVHMLESHKETVRLARSLDLQTLGRASLWLRENVKLEKTSKTCNVENVKLERMCTDKDPKVVNYATCHVRLYFEMVYWLKKRSPDSEKKSNWRKLYKRGPEGCQLCNLQRKAIL